MNATRAGAPRACEALRLASAILSRCNPAPCKCFQIGESDVDRGLFDIADVTAMQLAEFCQFFLRVTPRIAHVQAPRTCCDFLRPTCSRWHSCTQSRHGVLE